VGRFDSAGTESTVQRCFRAEAGCRIACIHTLYGSESVEDLLNKEA
jgi:hypothetical protein